MKDTIITRIDELVREINDLLSHRDKLSSQIDRMGNEVSGKQGAIYELKRLLDTIESSQQSQD